jgi:hypothetical protein
MREPRVHTARTYVPRDSYLSLFVGDAAFALAVDGALVLRLPKARVDELVAARRGRLLDPRSPLRPKTELVVLSATCRGRIELTREARRYASRRAKAR